MTQFNFSIIQPNFSVYFECDNLVNFKITFVSNIVFYIYSVLHTNSLFCKQLEILFLLHFVPFCSFN